MVFTLFWVLSAREGGGGATKGLVQNLLMQFFTLGNSKIGSYNSCFFGIVIT